MSSDWLAEARDKDQLLSLASHWVDDCLQEDEAVIVTGGWLLLQEAQRWICAWEGVVLTERYAGLHHRVREWPLGADQPLLCTPRWLVEQGSDVIRALSCPLNVVLLVSCYRRRIIASLTEIREAFALLDVPAETQTIYDRRVAPEPVTFKLRPGKVSKQWAWLF